MRFWLALGGLAALGAALEIWRRHRAWWEGPHLVEQLDAWAASDPPMPRLTLPERRALQVTRRKIRRRPPASVVRARFDRKG